MRRRGGFSLVEVCLAMTLIGGGILLLFGLFPAGLRESEYSMGDTHIGLFADYVLSGMHANSAGITSWNDWQTQFQTLSIAGLGVLVTGGPGGGTPPPNSDLVQFPGGTANDIRYTLDIQPVSGSSRLWAAEMYISFGDIGWMPTYFRTEFFYSGMQ